jgi:hypothetical protein
MENYDIRYDDKYGQLTHIDLAAEGAAHDPWFNQTLTTVNDCVVRLAVIDGWLVDWHKHETRMNSFSCSKAGLSSRYRGAGRLCSAPVRG